MSYFKLVYQDKYGEEITENVYQDGEYAIKLATKYCKNYEINVEIWHYPDYEKPIKLSTFIHNKNK
jgi:hypothetical protein